MMRTQETFSFKQRLSPDSGAYNNVASRFNALAMSSGKKSPESGRPTPTPMMRHQGVGEMNSTGQSFYRQSLQLDTIAPARVSATKKFASPAVAGGFQLNAAHTDPTENAFNREHNRLAGFGPGMGGTLIGNAGRRGNSLVVNDVKDNRTALGSFGWGLDKKHLD